MHTFFSLSAIEIGTKLAKENVQIARIYFIAILILKLKNPHSRGMQNGAARKEMFPLQNVAKNRLIDRRECYIEITVSKCCKKKTNPILNFNLAHYNR